MNTKLFGFSSIFSGFSGSARFIAGNGGVQDLGNILLNSLEDSKNVAGTQYNPDQEEYWNIIKKKIKTFTDAELFFLNRPRIVNDRKIRKMIDDELTIRYKWRRGER